MKDFFNCDKQSQSSYEIKVVALIVSIAINIFLLIKIIL